MTGVSLERLADTLYPKPEPKNATAYGTVESVNADGSYQVKLNASATTTRCAKLCDAEVGDRVLVLIQANGHCAAIGRVGGTDLPIKVEDGGTGATTSSTARGNLGFTSGRYSASVNINQSWWNGYYTTLSVPIATQANANYTALVSIEQSGNLVWPTIKSKSTTALELFIVSVGNVSTSITVDYLIIGG